MVDIEKVASVRCDCVYGSVLDSDLILCTFSYAFVVFKFLSHINGSFSFSKVNIFVAKVTHLGAYASNRKTNARFVFSNPETS